MVHVVGIIDGNYDTHLYINGVKQSESANMSSLGDTNYELTLGEATYQDTIDGALDDVRIYNRVLSDEEIQRLYELGGTTHVNKTITTNPDLENGLVGRWTFDGDLSQQITDLTGNGNNGYLVTGGESTSTKIVPGAIGQGLTFDGTDDYADMGDSSELDFGSSDFTVSVWAKRHALSTSYDNQWAVNKWKSGGSVGQNEFNLGFGCASGSDYPCFTVESGTTYYTATSSIAIADTNAWHLLTGVREGSDIKVYVDGVLGDTLNYGGGAINNAGRTFRVAQSANTASFFTNASFDDIRLYNRALSAEEVQRLYGLGR